MLIAPTQLKQTFQRTMYHSAVMFCSADIGLSHGAAQVYVDGIVAGAVKYVRSGGKCDLFEKSAIYPLNEMAHNCSTICLTIFRDHLLHK